MDIFAENGSRYNLLNSAVIEMVNFIRQENIKSLCKELVTQHSQKFESVEYVQTFKDLHLKYEQNQELASGDGDPGSESPKEGEDVSEYNYFNEDSDDEDKKNSSTGMSASEQAAFDKQAELNRQKRKLEHEDIDLTDLISAKRKRDPPGVISSGPVPSKGGISFDLNKKANGKKRRT